MYLVSAQPLYNWKPVLGTKLLGYSRGRGSGALKGLMAAEAFGVDPRCQIDFSKVAPCRVGTEAYPGYLPGYYPYPTLLWVLEEVHTRTPKFCGF